MSVNIDPLSFEADAQTWAPTPYRVRDTTFFDGQSIELVPDYTVPRFQVGLVAAVLFLAFVWALL